MRILGCGLAPALVHALLATTVTTQGPCTARPFVENVGAATPGTIGPPTLSSTLPIIGQPLSLRVTGCTPGTTGVAVLGLTELPVFLAQYGVTWYVGPLPVSVAEGFTCDPQGNSTPFFNLPQVPANCCGVRFIAQAAILDSGGTGGASFTQAVRLRCGGLAGLAPQLDPVTSPTAAADATVTGIGFATGNRIVVDGGAVRAEGIVDAQQRFRVRVPLVRDRLNRLYVREELAGGGTTPSAAVDVVQDSTGPELHVDFPPSLSVVPTPTTTVAGRIGDKLSGAQGLSITVDGIPGIVNVGVGTNGTFDVPGVPLALGQPKTVLAIAKDALGNETRASIVLFHEPPAGAALVRVSGDRQTAPVRTAVPSPLEVLVLRPDGVTPFGGKLVSFRVTRSDGRLRRVPTDPGVTTLQVEADVMTGVAKALWTLGSDAGCANNRVEVTTESVQEVVWFCASAEAPTAATAIHLGSGGEQVGAPGGLAPECLRVFVSDGQNGVAGVPVTFTVREGGGGLTRGSVRNANAITVPTSATGHADVALLLGPDPGQNLVEATFAQNPGLPVAFVVHGLAPVPQTRFAGIVLDNSLLPIGGAVCTLRIGSDPPIVRRTDDEGQFAFDGLTSSGLADLVVDGANATTVGRAAIPQGTRFPSLHYEPFVHPGVANELSRPVLLPRLYQQNRKPYDTTQDVVLTCAGIDGLEMRVVAGTRVTLPNGQVASPSNPVLLSLDQVDADDVPMPMPDGIAPPFAWTLQPGGTTFDPPVAIRFPNMAREPAGAESWFLSYDHDTGRFEIVATGRVLEDGSASVTDPQSGIRVSGWGSRRPPPPPPAQVEPCTVRIRGPQTICPGQTVTLSAIATPAGGTYVWEQSGGSSASFQPSGPLAFVTAGSGPSSSFGDNVFHVTYTPPGGRTCSTRDGNAPHRVTVVQVTIPNLARPNGQCDGIPPRALQQHGVQITPDISAGSDDIFFDVESDGSGSGSARITNNQRLKQSADLELLGTEQTHVGSADRLRIVARLNSGSGPACGESAPFTVCAHPTGFEEEFGMPDPNRPGVLIFRYTYRSDSGDLRDLDEVGIDEHVDYPGTAGTYTAPFPFRLLPWPDPDVVPRDPDPPQPGTQGFINDAHKHVTDPGECLMPGPPTASFQAVQHYRYRCERCVSQGSSRNRRELSWGTILGFIPAGTSFFVTRTIEPDPTSPSGWSYKVTKFSQKKPGLVDAVLPIPANGHCK
jgi:hypothetical protein